MKFPARLLSLLLAGSMLFALAACSSQNADEPSSPSETASPSASPETTPDSLLPEDFVVDTSVEDVCLATLGVPGKSELFTVNGTPVTAHNYLYWLLRCIEEIETYMSYFGIPLDLSADATLAEDIKANALTAAAQQSIVKTKAKELGFDLTAEQVSELDVNLALSAQYMGGNEVFLDELRKAGFDFDSFYAVNAASYYYLQLKNGLFSTPPTVEDMAAYIEENDILLAKHILLMTVDATTRQPLDEATIAQKKATAEDILSQLQASDDLLTDFDALMHVYSEDPGLASYPDGYTFTAGEMVPEFETATRELEYGQVSGIVESSTTGYHIILRLNPDTEAARADYLDAQLTSQIETWAAEAEIVPSEAYNAIDIALFYEKYAAYQAAFAQEAAAATP